MFRLNDFFQTGPKISDRSQDKIMQRSLQIGFLCEICGNGQHDLSRDNGRADQKFRKRWLHADLLANVQHGVLRDAGLPIFRGR
jgi:hypothetical protein